MIHWFFTDTVTYYLWMAPLIYIFCILTGSYIARKVLRAKGRIEEKYYLRSLKMRFPEAEDITLIAVETSDAAAMTKIKEQLRDEHRKRVRRRT